MCRAMSSSPMSFWAAGISFDLSSISTWANTRAVSTAKALRTWAAFRSLKLSKAVPEGLAIQGDPALRRSWSGGVEPRGMPAKHRFDRRGVESLKDVADRGVRRSLLPSQTEGGVQARAMHVQERTDAAIGGRSGHHRQDREQQQLGKRVELALGAPRIRDVAEQSQQLIERIHGSLRAI